ncbi:MAG: hypothetical protein KIT84_00700 [Labilithrix sp.]|nr:hypothetical protein [Labilithrix sp.]MCW5809502.1 hypothetical protein [Labilithrix sp.]
MKRFFFVSAAAVSAGALFWSTPGCVPDLNVDVNLPDGSLPDGPNLSLPKGVGEPCETDPDCRPGLACKDKTCQPGRSTPAGGDCIISAECVADHYCGPEAKCAPAGSGDDGAACQSDGDCKAGLRCNIVGLATQCQPEGNKDVGGACQTAGECFGGLVCAPDGKCAPFPGGPIAIPKFTGVPCDPPETENVTAFFEVPRGGAALKDYFRLPYPNDVRTSATGKPVMKDFPTPGADILGYDLVARWASFIEASPLVTGFSAYPTTIFRFSGEIDFASLDPKDTTVYVDLTTGQKLAHNWGYTTGRSAYVCENSISFRPPLGGPLVSGHTYAVFFTTAVKAKDGKDIVRSADLNALLGATDPGGELGAGWRQYEKLRTWAPANSVPLASILNAAIFTVGDHDAVGKALPQLVSSSPAPAAKQWVKCGGGAVSPCAQRDGERACPATPAAGIDEYHALISIPLFQRGNEPFIEPADDGAFVNAPATKTVDVCAALTVPAGSAAVGPLPTVIYAHGTGGTFRSHAAEGNVGPRLAKKGFAVLGIDQVGHGTRRGASTADPSVVFFNFSNPPAAQGNVLQGAADQVALVQLLKSNVTVTGTSITLSSTQIGYWGHSQGATAGAIAMPYVSGVAGAVFSGEGGSLIDSLLTKTSPVNFAALAPALLSELPQNVNANHPVLTMFQNAIDPADPLDHAANATAASAANIFPKHLFVPYGQLDTYSTPITQHTYIAAAGLEVAPNAPSAATPDKLYRDPSQGPVTNNKNGKTVVTRQYGKPANSDGHFVAFRDNDAMKDVDDFLATALKGEAPTIPAP